MAISTLTTEKRKSDVVRPTKEKFLWITSDINPAEYLAYLRTVLPVDEKCLKFLTELLAGNNQICPRVLYRNFRLIENILLWDVQEGKKAGAFGKRQNSQTAAKLLTKLTQALDAWDKNIFSTNNYEYGSEANRGQYKTAARFVVAQAAPFFTSLNFISSPDAKAMTIRTALSLITESAEYDNYISAILKGRAMQSGAKSDIGEDEFYGALVELVASWNKDERKAITKQLGDMLGIGEEQNGVIHVPVTRNMVSLADLILANIRLHNQNDADFSKAPANEKAVGLAARGSELGTEPLPAFMSKLQSALKQGKFSESEKILASQLFEIMFVEARLFNPTIILAIVETYGHAKLREALIKAYSRRDQSISPEKIDDVLMYMMTGTLTSKPSSQAHSLTEQGLGWLMNDLSDTKLVDLVATLIRTTAKFGLHTIKGINPMPQSHVLKAGEKIKQGDLEDCFSVLNTPQEQRSAASKATHNKENHTVLSLEECLIANRQKLSPEMRRSLEIRMGRFLEVENTLWDAVVATIGNRQTKTNETAVALWSLSFTTCVNLLDEPKSGFFQLDPELVSDFSSTLAQRITARYDSIIQLQVTADNDICQRLKAAFSLSINRAAGRWNPLVTKALFTQVEVIVAQNDTHYFSGLIPNIINAVTLEQVPSAKGRPAGYRAEYQEETVKLLATLLKKFSGNTLVVGRDPRMSLVTTLSGISGDLTQLAAEWTGAKEYQWQKKIDVRELRQKEREIAAVAQLLNLLAGHAGGSPTPAEASKGQITLANVINEAIAIEIAAVFQAEMPSGSLLTNIFESGKKLHRIEAAGETQIEKLHTVARTQLKNIKELAKHKKLTLTTVQQLIKAGLGSFETTIDSLSSLKLTQQKKNGAEEQVDLYDLLASLARQYLVAKHDPEIAPIGAVLAEELAKRFDAEEMARAPISKLRDRIAAVLGETMTEDLSLAIKLDAEHSSQTVLAASLARNFEAAELFKAVERAELTEDDVRHIQEYLEEVRRVRRMVIDPHGKIEQRIAQIRRNLSSVLGVATHQIRMPDWNSISDFMVDETEALVVSKVQKA